MSNNLNQRKPLFYGLAFLFALWGILGALDIKNYTYAGFDTDAYTVIKVNEDSPAERAGLQVGDILTSDDGIPITDLQARNQQARRVVGQTKTFGIARNGTDQSIAIPLAAQPSKQRLLNYVGRFLGFLFLLTGLWIFATSTHKVKSYFAFFALFFSMAFLAAPYIEQESVRKFVNSLNFFLILTGFVFLIRFLLQYPPISSQLQHKATNYFLYVPAILLGSFMFFLELFLPADASAGFLSILNAAIGLVIAFYFAWALWLLIQKYQQSSVAQRQQNGTSLLLAGALIGILPMLFLIVMNILTPKTVLPGGEYFFLSFGAIPILFAMAIKRLESTATESTNIGGVELDMA